MRASGFLLPRVVFIACVAGALASLHANTPLSSNGNGPRPLVPHNLSAADTANADELYPNASSLYDLTGDGVRVGIWDDGRVLTSHQDLAPRVTLAGAGMPSDHATHVAGTILSSGQNDASARGLAPRATAISYSWQDDAQELAAVASILSVSNHAYGPALGWFDNPLCDDMPSWVSGDDFEDEWLGKYLAEASAIDDVASRLDHVAVWSAGNTRRDAVAPDAPHYHHPSCLDVYTDEHRAQDAYDSLGGSAVAKNVITVGAIGDVTLDPIPSADVRPLYFSPFGPSDDARIKPDLVASGFTVYSTLASSDDAYGAVTGTSPASAVVTGSIALLVEHYRKTHAGRDPRGAEVRALLVQTARDDDEIQGPDVKTGFGLVDARAAADLVARDATSEEHGLLRTSVISNTAQDFTSRVNAAEGQALQFTLAWLDSAAPASTKGVDDATPTLVNDLDLELIAPDGMTRFYPWALDTLDPTQPALRTGPNRRDTVEVVRIDAADNIWSGVWTARVRVRDDELAHGSTQAYALASSVPLSAPPVAVLGMPRYVEVSARLPDARASVPIRIDNLGSGSLALEVRESPSWLTLEVTGGTAPMDAELRVEAASLPAGDHVGLLRIAAGEEADERTLGVYLHLLPCGATCGDRRCGQDECGNDCGTCAAGLLCRDGGCEPDVCHDVECGQCLRCIDGACLAAANGTRCDLGEPVAHEAACLNGGCIAELTADAGPPTLLDGGIFADASTTTSDASAPASTTEAAAGCSCRVTRGATGLRTWGAAIYLLFLAMLAARRRRRRIGSSR